MAFTTLKQYFLSCEKNPGKGGFAASLGNGAFSGITYSMMSMWQRMQTFTSGAQSIDGSQVLDHEAAPALLKSPRLPGTSVRKLYLAEMEWGYGWTAATSSVNRSVFAVWDRLWEQNDLPVTSTSHTIAGATPSRYTDGEGVMIALDNPSTYTGTAGCMLTVTYTNDKGVAGRVTPDYPFGLSNLNNTANCFNPIPLADGDTGVRSIQAVNLSVAGTSGNFGIVLVKLLGFAPIDNNAQVERGNYRNLFSGGGIMEVKPNACLMLAGWNGNAGTSAHAITGRLNIIEAPE